MKTRNSSTPATTSGAPCPCGLPAAYAHCCGRFHQADEAGNYPAAPDAERLMRSRYSAFVHGLTDYLRVTWHASTRPDPLDLEDAGLRWLGLQVKRVSPVTPGDAHTPPQAWVEFVARSKQAGRAHRLHETSRFVFEAGRWTYIDGVMHDS